MKNFIQNLDDKIKYAEDSLKELKEALETTNKFLNECEKIGIKTVSIGRETKKVKSANANKWPFPFSNSVFADGSTKGGWPLIWRVSEKFKFSGAVGNRGQHSISPDAKLIEGVYSFKKGKWYETED